MPRLSDAEDGTRDYMNARQVLPTEPNCEPKDTHLDWKEIEHRSFVLHDNSPRPFILCCGCPLSLYLEAACREPPEGGVSS